MRACDCVGAAIFAQLSADLSHSIIVILHAGRLICCIFLRKSDFMSMYVCVFSLVNF